MIKYILEISEERTNAEKIIQMKGIINFVAFLVWNFDGKSISHHDLISLAF